jgi:glyoxylase-like metal-dependent hydrolase (beta-lactamase superfamily II)
MEMPYLTGRANYPPPDPTVGRGLMARMSPLFPQSGIDISEHVHELAPDSSVPGMPGWRWVSTPGHSPGHVSFFREHDRALVAGDAATTTRQESVFSVMTQMQELNGPPAYFTIDWEAARQSVATLASLKPRLLATGHGEPMSGESMTAALDRLALDFERLARPRRGRYVARAAVVDRDGFVITAPAVPAPAIRWGTLAGVAVGAFAATWLVRRAMTESP